VKISGDKGFALQGLIPANGEIWKTRRRAVVPALHRKYLESMINLFGDSNLHGITQLEQVPPPPPKTTLGNRDGDSKLLDIAQLKHVPLTPPPPHTHAQMSPSSR